MPKSRTKRKLTKIIAALSLSNQPNPLLLQNNDINNSSNHQQSLPKISSEIINKNDLTKLSTIVTDLITGKHDETIYEDFLFIFKHFSVRSLRDDHLEETFYHLIQAGITFIRTNQQRFDKNKLEECYRYKYQS
ncbi:unnamed protein product [Adineta steineri]|uniref:Uncharacterized protein n=1 Tax=Adineta steineri TaxID=433720 RepID=A0A819B9Y0_9BILA|nr:unnamed protein product [Adineta steineri]CAF3793303.1 unnamed protein product [Adineta steineri]